MFRIGPNLKLKILFWEFCSADEKDHALFTLKKVPHAGLPSLYQLYMEASDLVEYDFAIKHFENWAHWDRLCQCTWFQDHIAEWRKELAIKVKAEAVRAIQLEAKGKGKNSYQANKWLIEKGWIETSGTSKKVGRPTKEEVKEFITPSDLKDDFNRLFKTELN